MARKRLTPADPGFLTPAPATRAPIAAVAGDAASAAAFHDLAEEMTRARAEGRMVLSLPLEAIAAGHLQRDRLPPEAHDEAMGALKASLATRGQQTPIEVVELEPGRYGLISGWRRLAALQALFAETGEARFATALALVRAPESDAAAYVAMVEENEIRADLSYFERARLVRRAIGAGVFDSEQAALQALFATASYAKRSKIKSFLTVVDALEGALAFPARLNERSGLVLAKALGADPTLAARLKAALVAASPQSAEAEQAVIAAALAPAQPAPRAADGPAITVKRQGQKLMLSGPGITDDFAQELAAWLAARAS